MVRGEASLKFGLGRTARCVVVVELDAKLTRLFDRSIVDLDLIGLGAADCRDGPAGGQNRHQTSNSAPGEINSHLAALSTRGGGLREKVVPQLRSRDKII